MNEVTRSDEWHAAPAPYSTVDIGSRADQFHTYVLDANGRKIGVAWGPVAEKVWTAALWAAAPDYDSAARSYVDWIGVYGAELPADVLRAMENAFGAKLRAALSKAKAGEA